MRLLQMTTILGLVLGLASDGSAKSKQLHDTAGNKGHTVDQCKKRGGTVKDYGSYASICRIKGTRCPVGWKRAKDKNGKTWQTAMPVTCRDVDISKKRKCGSKLRSRQTPATGSFTNGSGYNVNAPAKYSRWDFVDKDGGHSVLKKKSCKVISSRVCSPQFKVTEVGCL